MTQEEREELITFIKEHSFYNYSAVNFKYYNDADLLALKEKAEMDRLRKSKLRREDDEIRPSVSD